MPRAPSSLAPATSGQVSGRAMSAGQPSRGETSLEPLAGRSGVEPPFPLSHCRRRARLVDSAGFDPTPHSLDRQDARRRYGFRCLSYSARLNVMRNRLSESTTRR